MMLRQKLLQDKKTILKHIINHCENLIDIENDALHDMTLTELDKSLSILSKVIEYFKLCDLPE